MLPSIKVPPLKPGNSNAQQDRSSFREQDPRNISPEKEATAHNESPLLPLISEGSFTSLVSSKSSRSKWKERIKQSKGAKQTNKPKVKRRGAGFREYPSGMDTVKESRNDRGHSTIKTTHLQLNYNFGTVVDKGWSQQHQNPRLTKLQNVSGRFHGAPHLNYVNFPNYTEYTRAVAAPHVDYLYQRKQRRAVRDRTAKQDGDATMVTNGTIATNGTQASVVDRFNVPSMTSSFTITQPSPQPDHLPPLPTDTDHQSRDTTETTCIHRRTCGCSQGSGTESSVRLPSRPNTWDRGPTTPLKKVTIHRMSTSSTGGLYRLRPPPYKPPPVSPPKVPQNRSGLSLSRLRKKATKSLAASDSNEKLNEKRRKSSITVASTPTNVKQSRSKHGIKENKVKSPPKQETECEKEANDEEMPVEGEVVVVDEKPTSPTVEIPPVDMEIAEDTVLALENLDDCDARTAVESVSSIRSPLRAITPKLLKSNPDSFQESGELETLQKMFTMLDRDGDGHITFAELARSLPSDFTKRQTSYIYKIYQLACESTYFGLEEFVAVHQMCKIMSHIGFSAFQASDSTAMSTVENSVSLYMELFHSLDKKQSGSLTVASFKDLLSSALNVPSESALLQRVLDTMGKGSEDSVSSVELLAFLPYILSINPT